MLTMPYNNTTEQLPLPFVFEEWRQIPDYEGYYEASSLGRIRSVPRLVNTWNGQRCRNYLIRKTYFTRQGYLRVGLYLNNIELKYLVHRLIALAFLGECPEGKEVNHIDGVKAHNWVTNLEYVTRSENAKHAFRIGLKKIRYGGLLSWSKLTSIDAQSIREDKRVQRLIANEYNVCQTTISRIKSGLIWS